MKVIDLLNKIANGNIPKRIIYNEYVYQWNNIIKNYEREVDTDTTLNWDYIAIECLNDEVEIIEDTLEENNIKEIKYLNTDSYAEDVYYEKLSKEEICLDIQSLKHKINEIIDKVNGK